MPAAVHGKLRVAATSRTGTPTGGGYGNGFSMRGATGSSLYDESAMAFPIKT